MRKLIAKVNPEIIKTLKLGVSGTVQKNNIGAKPCQWKSDAGWIMWTIGENTEVQIENLKEKIMYEFKQIKQNDFILTL